jgi:vitamin B12 transporter
MLRRSLVVLSLNFAVGLVVADEAKLQPEVIVTATRVAQTVDDTLADVSIISRQDIEASATRDISDLLRLQAGIDIARTGGPGGQTSVFLRGTNNNHVLVLVDGVRVSSLNTGALTWETLPLAVVERIEIVRGPRASYWGSDAIGGVIQIFTRKLSGPRAALGYGRYGDAKADAGFGRRNEHGGYSVQIGARDVDGFPSQNENGFGFEDKDHGLRNRHFAARADRHWGDQAIEGAWTRSQGTAEFAGGASDFTEQALHARWSGSIRPDWQQRLNIGHASEDYETPAFFTRYRSRRDSIGWQNEVALSSSQRLVLGVDHLREQGENRDTFSDTATYRESRHNTGVYAGWQTTRQAFDSDLSLRVDDNSLFGRQTTGSVAAGWHFSEALRAYLSYGHGFRGPTLNEQYSPGFGGLFAGNPELEPERSRSGELGLEWTPSAGQRIKAQLYSTRIRNLISFSGTDFRAENVARARIRGAELGYERRLGEWQVASSLTWQRARNEDTDTDLLRRPRQKTSASIDRGFGPHIKAGIEVLRSGPRSDVGGIRLPGYALVNLRASWLLSRQWRLAARIENLTDRDYELAYGYNTPGRSGFVEIVWSKE